MRALGPVAKSQRADFRASAGKAAGGDPGAASAMLPEVTPSRRLGDAGG